MPTEILFRFPDLEIRWSMNCSTLLPVVTNGTRTPLRRKLLSGRLFRRDSAIKLSVFVGGPAPLGNEYLATDRYSIPALAHLAAKSPEQRSCFVTNPSAVVVNSSKGPCSAPDAPSRLPARTVSAKAFKARSDGFDRGSERHEDA